MNGTFAKRLKMARAAAGLTLEGLAEKTGATKSLLVQYESGAVKQCRMEMLFAISDTLKVSPRWLATGAGTQAYVGGILDSERDLILYVRLMPREKADKLIAIAEAMVSTPGGPANIEPIYLHHAKL